MQILDYNPRINTIIMVEQTLQEADSIITIAELKKKLPKQVNHNTLKAILEYLEEHNKIAVSIKGITWIYNTNKRLRQAINTGLEL